MPPNRAKYQGKDLVKKILRKSPLNIDEIIDPEMAGSSIYGTTYIDPDTKQPIIRYNPAYADDPVTQRHERIHAEQMRLPQNLSLKDIEKIYTPYMIQKYSEVGDPIMETPAYQMSSMSANIGSLADKQNRTNQYLDLIRQKNPENYLGMQTSIEPELLREFVKSHPQPGPSFTRREIPISSVDQYLMDWFEKRRKK